MEILANGEFWVAVGFIAMIGIFLYAGAPKFIGKHLDDRAVAIKAELDEAARLRAEAEAVLADYKRKAANAEAAAAAAEKLITARLDEKRAGALVEASLKDLGAKLN